MNRKDVHRAIEQAEKLVALAATGGELGEIVPDFPSDLPRAVVDDELERWAMVFGRDVAALAEFRRLSEADAFERISDVNIERAGVTARFVVRQLSDRLAELHNLVDH